MGKEKKRALIINHLGFSNVGGIETYLYSLIKYCIKSKIRVIWLCHSKPIVCESFRDVLFSDYVERVFVKSLNWYWFQYEMIPLKKDERYLIFTCTPQGMCASQDIMLKYNDYDIFPVYAIANTTGEYYFLERYFKKTYLNKKVFSIMRDMIKRWETNDAIRFFNLSHAEALEANYGIEIKNKQEKVLRGVVEPTTPNFGVVGKRYKKEGEFVILTVGRMCFPHKGYMLGLIQSFGKLKEKYPQLQLHIIGDGQERYLLEREIDKLSATVKDSIKMIGEVSPTNLSVYYRDADLNISVAGAAVLGAAAGVLTLVAQNFCEGECRVYGFYNDCPEKVTSTEKGVNVEPYIIEAIEMSDEAYMARCKKGFEVFEKNSDVNPEYLFDTTENLYFKPSKHEIRKMKILKRIIKANRYLRSL